MTYFVLPSTVVDMRAADELVLLDMTTRDVLHLNQTACVVVESLRDGASVEEVIDAFCAAVGGERARVSADVLTIVDELVGRRYLVKI